MWKAQTIPSDGIGRIDAGNAVLSKWDIESAERIQLPLRGDQDELTRLFYLRRNVLKTKIAIPGQDNFYVVNTHSTAFATDDTKQKHIDTFVATLDDIDTTGNSFISGGDLNSIPPGAAEYDFCLKDVCPGNEYHTDTDGGPHREGSYFNDEERTLLENLYNAFNPAIPLDDADKNGHFTHSTASEYPWDRKLDYLFTNLAVVENSGQTHQNTIMLSDHAPVTARVTLP
jgi:endonuclease/exonuclease/phosphatase family metal-dependent hydrolase